MATSFKRSKALEFKDRARAKGFPAAVYEIKLKDPNLDVAEGGGGCNQVNFLEKSLLTAEKEFLFSSYSAFKVLGVDTSLPEFTRITLEACVDNKDAPEDCPSAPWI